MLHITWQPLGRLIGVCLYSRSGRDCLALRSGKSWEDYVRNQYIMTPGRLPGTTPREALSIESQHNDTQAALCMESLQNDSRETHRGATAVLCQESLHRRTVLCWHRFALTLKHLVFRGAARVVCFMFV